MQVPERKAIEGMDGQGQKRIGEEGSPDSQAIGLIIAKQRRHLNMTQEELAERASISRQSVCNIEQGKQKPSGRTLMGLCRALRISIDALEESEGKAEGTPDKRLHIIKTQISGFSEEEQSWIFETLSLLCDGLRYRGYCNEQKRT